MSLNQPDRGEEGVAAVFDIVELTRALIKCPSVTPADAGALDVLQRVLEGLDFVCYRLPFGVDGPEKVDNLYARLGTRSPKFCYAGHTDVVPPGHVKDWSHAPFEASVEDGLIYGRGAVDMKGAIAAFLGAVERFQKQLSASAKRVPGSISLLLTGDEEGAAINGTKKMLDWLIARGETFDHCLVGEPTNPEQLGDMIKIGRRGSLNARVTVKGVQGHGAYSDGVDSSVHRPVKLLSALESHPLDGGTEDFEPSKLEITSIDIGNEATNIIPTSADARFNIRFNDCHDGASLSKWIRGLCDFYAKDYDLDIDVSGEAFLTSPGKLSDIVSAAVAKVAGAISVLSTSGGTSDACFIKDVCPVVEFGLISRTMHKVDECVAISDLELLSDIYLTILDQYFLKVRK